MKTLIIMLCALFMGSTTISYAASEAESVEAKSGEAPSEVAVTAETGDEEEDEEEDPACD